MKYVFSVEVIKKKLVELTVTADTKEDAEHLLDSYDFDFLINTNHITIHTGVKKEDKIDKELIVAMES